LGVTEGVASKGIEGGERAWPIDALGLFLLPRCQQQTTKGKISLKILCLQREDSQQLPFPPFGLLRRRKRERRGWFGGLGFATSDFKFEFEFICKKVLKTYQIVSRGFKYIQKVMAKVW
jgi:hypothetical protein